MADKENFSVVTWLSQNTAKSCANDYVDLVDILQKINIPNISKRNIGRGIQQLYENINISRVRCKEDWGKLTQRYHGITWKNPNSVDKLDSFNSIIENISSFLPDDFFIISKVNCVVKLGYFTSRVVNGNRTMLQITLSEGKWFLQMNEKEINLQNVGISNDFTFSQSNIETVLNTVKILKFCNGFNSNELQSQDDSIFYKEHMSQAGDENSHTIRIRAHKCLGILPNESMKLICQKCKYYLKRSNKKNKDSSIHTCSVEKEPAPDQSNQITLEKDDHEDLSEIFHKLFPECNAKMSEFLMSQKMALERNKHGRRWNKDIVRLCLTLWCRSPRGYSELCKSGFIVLPSQRLLQIYKNSVQQEAGINSNVLNWMANEAAIRNIPPEGYEGGILIDEMSIQSDLQFSKVNGRIELIGFTDLTPESIVMDKIKTGKSEQQLATHVLQFVFIGFTGFRFPFAHFPSVTASGSELYLLFWKAVHMLAMFNFKVTFVSTDGAQSNRDMMHILLPDFSLLNPTTMAFKNIYNRDNDLIFFIMDFSHLIKKIRNNISKSGTNNHCKRHLEHKGLFISWEHFKKAYLWDISHNPFPVHHKLTNEHLFLSNEGKMRNHLAEDVLNCEMLHLMQVYQQSLGDKGAELNLTIELLKNTSVLIRNFRDPRPITDPTDDRLSENNDVLQWFLQWEQDNRVDISIKNKEKSLISLQTRQDIVSCLLGFDQLCKHRLKCSSSSIVPKRANSDLIENMFCQQRTLYNGANTNPTYLGYCRSVNAVILGQTSVSRKSNSGGGSGAELMEKLNKK